LWPFFGCKLWVLFVDGLEDRVANFVEHSAKGAPEYPGLDRIFLCLDKKTDPMEFPGNKVQVAQDPLGCLFVHGHSLTRLGRPGGADCRQGR
jgi:hypothetical protein